MREQTKRYLANKGREIKDTLRDDNTNIIVVNGEAGTGKTTLLNYILKTVAHKNVTVFGFKEPNTGLTHNTCISLSDSSDTLFLMDEYPHIHITNLKEELKKMRKQNNKIILFSHPKSPLLDVLEGLPYKHIQLGRDYI